MATKTWIDNNGNWNTAGDWNPASVPGPGDDAVIPFGTVSLTTPVTVGSISLTTSSATLGIASSGTDAVTGDFSNSGTVGVDFGASSGSTLTIGGTLTNASSGTLNIGYSGLTADTTVAAAGLSNAGTINLDGSASARAILNIAGSAPATLVGSVSLFNSALLEFGSGSITSIANGAALALYSGSTHVAIAGNTGSNSALTQLSSNAGTLTLQNSSVATNPGTDFSNSGSVGLTATAMTLGGAFTNSGTFIINPQNQNIATTLSATGFSNTGTFDVLGYPAQASATFGGSPPSTLTGNIRLLGDASLQFTGGGAINSIASGAALARISTLADRNIRADNERWHAQL
jgi:fibronectin-binding autotransporter adhesin